MKAVSNLKCLLCTFSMVYIALFLFQGLGKVAFVMLSTPFGFDSSHYERSFSSFPFPLPIYYLTSFLILLIACTFWARNKKVSFFQFVGDLGFSKVSIWLSLLVTLLPAILMIVLVMFFSIFIDSLEVGLNIDSATFFNNINLKSFQGVLMLFSMVVFVPIVEEYIFRGWLYNAVSNVVETDIIKFFLLSAFFAFLHSSTIQSSLMYISIFFLSLLLCFIRWKLNNLTYCAIAHASWNLLFLFLVDIS